MTAAPSWAALCLAADPFAGDFGGDRLLSDQIVRVRAPAVCNTCEGPIIKGSFARRRTEIYDGDLERFAWCELCCVAMADPDPTGWEAREAMGFERRAKFEGGVL